MATTVQRIEWKCTRCGTTRTRKSTDGRPDPGRCPNTGGKPHAWVKNRKY